LLAHPIGFADEHDIDDQTRNIEQEIQQKRDDRFAGEALIPCGDDLGLLRWIALWWIGR
jgi:hypothetical protein